MALFSHIYFAAFWTAHFMCRHINFFHIVIRLSIDFLLLLVALPARYY